MASKMITEWLKEDKMILLKGWARNGLTQEQIAKKMNISLTTFKNWKNNSKDFENVLKGTNEVVDFDVEGALYKSAIGYWIHETTEEEELDKDGNVVSRKRKTVHKFIPGNVTAQIFWLKNRMQQFWSDRNIQKIETNDKNEIKLYINGVDTKEGSDYCK